MAVGGFVEGLLDEAVSVLVGQRRTHTLHRTRVTVIGRAATATTTTTTSITAASSFARAAAASIACD